MATRSGARILVVLAASAVLLGCEDGKSPFASRAAGGRTTAPAQVPSGAGGKDVEAPDLFHVVDQGLWDGRPSLGGIWVASTEVKEPERVIIRNEANGNFVVGALFRREVDNPGPPLQVSSDAADALGMLAGAPASLNVTALKREDVTPETTEAAAAISSEPVEAAPLSEGTAPDDTVIAGAAAALDRAAGDTAAPSGAAAEPPVRKPLFGFLRRKPAAPETAAPAPDAIEVAATPVSTLAKPSIQVGIFSSEAVADATVEKLRAGGVTGATKSRSSRGKTIWRVVAGPAMTSAERTTLLDKVKALGFTDAYPVTD